VLVENVKTPIYNIAFVNSECWLAKSRVDITLCQHGKFPAALNSNAYRPKCASYIIKKYKTFSVLIYSYINTRENWKNSKLCENTPPFGRRVSTQFLVFPISTRVDITVYQHGKCFIFLKYHITQTNLTIWSCCSINFGRNKSWWWKFAWQDSVVCLALPISLLLLPFKQFVELF
jgi:hypothetical protein